MFTTLLTYIPPAYESGAIIRLFFALLMWFITGLGLGLFISRFVAPIARWLAITFLLLLLLVGMGVATVETNSVSFFFKRISEFLMSLGSSINTLVAGDANIRNLVLVFFVLGMLFGLRYNNRSGSGQPKA